MEADMSSEAKVNISMLEGKIEFSGSEGFVKEQLSLFKSIIETTLKSTPRQTVIQPTPATPQQKVASEIQPATNYLRVFDISGEKIKITAKIPGRNLAEKTVNISLLYLLAKSLKNEDAASTAELREACKEHAVLDSGNFMKYLKTKKQYFIINGGKKSKLVKLAFPGKERASELATELNA